MNLGEIKNKQKLAYEIIDGAWEEGSHEALADGYQKAFGLIDEALSNSIDAVEIVDLYKEWQRIESLLNRFGCLFGWEIYFPHRDQSEKLNEWNGLVEQRNLAREAFYIAVEKQ